MSTAEQLNAQKLNNKDTRRHKEDWKFTSLKEISQLKAAARDKVNEIEKTRDLTNEEEDKHLVKVYQGDQRAQETAKKMLGSNTGYAWRAASNNPGRKVESYTYGIPSKAYICLSLPSSFSLFNFIAPDNQFAQTIPLWTIKKEEREKVLSNRPKQKLLHRLKHKIARKLKKRPPAPPLPARKLVYPEEGLGYKGNTPAVK